MQIDIKAIILPMPFHMGNVNCYLLKDGDNFILIDTGGSSNRKDLQRHLENSGCKSGMLKLIILTHGDFDHAGNASYLRDEFQSKIAMHAGDQEMVSQGDMFIGRKHTNILFRKLLPLFSGFGRLEHFVPDLLVVDGFDLSPYGLDARVISIPGHSPGSMGILTADHDFFCGDLMVNIDKPVLNSLTDDKAMAVKSLAKIKDLKVNHVFPGHGKSFSMEEMNY
jgi:hydroxyacylglutathione hydrolase